MSRFTVDVDYTPRRTDGGPGGLDMSKTVVHRVTVDAKDDNEACLLAAQLVAQPRVMTKRSPSPTRNSAPGVGRPVRGRESPTGW